MCMCMLLSPRLPKAAYRNVVAKCCSTRQLHLADFCVTAARKPVSRKPAVLPLNDDAITKAMSSCTCICPAVGEHVADGTHRNRPHPSL